MRGGVFSDHTSCPVTITTKQFGKTSYVQNTTLTTERGVVEAPGLRVLWVVRRDTIYLQTTLE